MILYRHAALAWGTGVPPHCKGVWGEEREEVIIIVIVIVIVIIILINIIIIIMLSLRARVEWGS